MIHARQYPCFCALLPTSVDEIRVLGALQGEIQVDAAVALLHSCMEEMETHRAEIVARSMQQQEDRSLREQQDREYQEALEMDRKLEEERREKEAVEREARRKEEEERRQEQEALERLEAEQKKVDDQ